MVRDGGVVFWTTASPLELNYRRFLMNIHFLKLGLAWGLMLLAPLVMAQSEFPAKPLRMVVPYPPGASTDSLGRIVAQKLSVSMGQPVVVDNKGGASGNIGSDFVAKSLPDGYTLMVGTDATHTANVFLTASPTFHPVKDFTALTQAVANPIVLVVHPGIPATNLAELIAYFKLHPDQLSYGSSGTGSPHHLAGELLKQFTGIPLVHVAYRGGGPAITDLLGGQIPMVFSSLITVLPHIKSGKLKAIGFTQTSRYSGLPQVPTFAETLPGFEMNSWLGFFAPAKLPVAVSKRLHGELIKALRDPEVALKLDGMGLMVVANTSEEFAEQVRKELEQRGKLIQQAGIKPE
jgi:tripartite-type tricarboxylate transporter receptor subunit TctC